MQFMTIDLEGDGIYRDTNQSIFKDGCHLDPNTRLWCCTFTIWTIDGFLTKTLVCKLPNQTRPIFDNNGNYVCNTVSKHELDTKVPSRIWAGGVRHKVTEIKDYETFIDTIIETMDNAVNKGLYIASKGYNEEYNYDKLILEIVLNKFNKPLPDWWGDKFINATKFKRIN